MALVYWGATDGLSIDELGGGLPGEGTRIKVKLLFRGEFKPAPENKPLARVIKRPENLFSKRLP